jgi:hypothetical protein
MNADGYTVVYCSYAVDGGYYVAKPGCFYLCDCSAGDLHFKMPSADMVPPGSMFAGKIIGGAGTHQPIFQAFGGEFVNGLPSVSLPQSGQGRVFRAGAPAGPAAGKGWMSQ